MVEVTMLPNELSELKNRCQMAAAHGYTIGKADLYVAELQKTVGVPALPPGVVANSAQHLLALIGMAEKGQKAPAKVAAAPKVAAPAPIEDKPAEDKPTEDRPAKKKGR